MKDRISEIISYKGLTPSKFADIIDIQRSRISHIMSGRNNPSIEIVTHIIEKFPEISLNWLMTGSGEMLNNKPNILSFSENSNSIEESKKYDFSKQSETKKQHITPKSFDNNTSNKLASTKDIDRIIVFYTDGSFKEYKPE